MFAGFVWGGFEGASHRRMDGRRVDSIADSQHDRWAGLDHALLRSMAVGCARESFRWHLIEQIPGQYDFTSALQQVRGARDAGVQVIWGLCHWGVPDHVDVMSRGFPNQLANFARAAFRILRAEGGDIGGWVPVNEMSFWSWAGGQTGGFAPFLHCRGDDLKHQLVLAHLAVVKALRAEGAFQPILVCEPLIWIVPEDGTDEGAWRARMEIDASFAAVDRILAADPTAIDVVGLNHYDHNQWALTGRRIHQGEAGHRPLRHLLKDAARRFSRPLVITETGAEEPHGSEWLRYVKDEAAAAIAIGVRLEGVCVYPILDYAGWDDARHCPCGPIGHRNGRRYVRCRQHVALQALAAVRPSHGIRQQAKDMRDDATAGFVDMVRVGQ